MASFAKSSIAKRAAKGGGITRPEPVAEAPEEEEERTSVATALPTRATGPAGRRRGKPSARVRESAAPEGGGE